MPQTVLFIPSVMVGGIIVAKTGKYLWATYLSWIFGTLGIGLLILLDKNTTTARWIFINCVSGLGLGLMYPANTFAIQAASTPADVSVAAGLITFFRSLGQVLGVVISTAIFENTFKHKLHHTCSRCVC